MKSILLSILLLSVFSHSFEKYNSYSSSHFHLGIGKGNNAHINELTAFCEATYDTLTTLFGIEPTEKIRIAFIDNNDYANGYAIPFKGWVGIYLPPADFALRGSHSWLKNVIAHEIAHVFSLQALGYTSDFLGVNLMGIYNRSAKPYSLSTNFVYFNSETAWIAEGLAQLGAELAGHDTWDAHRNMHERIRFSSNDIISLPQLATFSGDSRHNEGIYNQGYSFCRYLYSQLGARKFISLLEEGKKSTFSNAVELFLKKPYEEIYHDWLASQQKKHEKFTHLISAKSHTPIPDNSPYIINKSPFFVNNTLYYLSSAKNDFGITSLYRSTPDAEEELVDNIIGSPANNGATIYAIQSQPLKGHLIRNSIISYDITNASTKVIFEDARASAVAACGNKLYYVGREDGIQSIYEYELSSSQKNILHSSKLFEDIASLICTETDLLYTTVTKHGEDIHVFNLQTKTSRPLITTPFDERTPFIHENSLFFSADYDGAFQIYEYNFIDTSIVQHTQLRGGAFQPVINKQSLYVSAYDSAGYVISQHPLIESPHIPISIENTHTQISKIDTTHLTSITMKRILNDPITKNRSLGWGLTGYIQNVSMMEDESELFDFGPRIGFGGSYLWSNPTNQSSTSLSLLIGSAQNIGEQPFNNNVDPMFNITKTFHLFNQNTQFSTDLIYMSLDTIIRESTDTDDNQSDSLTITPQIVLAQSQMMSNHMISNNSQITYGPFLQMIGGSGSVKELGIPFNLSLGLIFIPLQTQLGFSISPVYYDVDPGIKYTNSGYVIGINISPTYVALQTEDEFISYPTLNLSPELRLFSNLHRRLFLNINGVVNSSIGYASIDNNGVPQSKTLYSLQGIVSSSLSLWIPTATSSRFKNMSIDLFSGLYGTYDNIPEVEDVSQRDIQTIRTLRNDVFFNSSQNASSSPFNQIPATSLGLSFSVGYFGWSHYYSEWTLGCETILKKFKRLEKPHVFLNMSF
ncbi:MAG: hypothetical protein OCC49_17290 [Fibrobacterales bacterium]